jgi:hypothetical protein
VLKFHAMSARGTDRAATAGSGGVVCLEAAR